MSDTILEMRSITKTFPGVVALDDVTLTVRRGEIHAICGENGAGKSTLMKVLSGVHPYGTYEGQIVYEGEEARFHSITDSEHEGIVIIHQELALSPFLSIAENIFLGNERYTKTHLIDWNRTNAEAQELMDRVGLVENPTTPISTVGVGKQQLVEIAKALSKSVKLLILDEPTAALNDNDSEHLLGLLRNLKAEGITCIMISHKLSELMDVADTITVIRDGHTIESMPAADATQERLIKDMVGREMSQRYPPRERHIGDELFRVEDWTVYHPTQPGRVMIDHANLNVRAGEVVGIAGLMGAGRTELAMSLFGHSYGAHITGRTYIRGDEVHLDTVDDAIHHGVAYVSEDRKRYGLNLLTDIKTNTTSAGLYKLTSKLFGFVNGNEEIKVAEEYRSKLGIKTPTVMAAVTKLSGGNQQKVVVAKWLYTDPDILILDEPTRGIDVGAKYEIYTIINAMVAQGKAVIVISSELPEIMGISDRIYTLSFGAITGEVPIAEATQENLMELMTKEKETLK
ncbi:MAG: ATP-binding cassette domain-containing protein [Propionibacteriaceae bacterium]|jgi:putative multiple sugar transport system ATP-binding protein|nr:ATP-binding cassette domain-containing protein [Propionibacteriaceae bacterium]